VRAAAVAFALALVLPAAGCGGGSGSGSGSQVEAGKKTFVTEGCGSCHTVAAAGTDGTLGPNLEAALAVDARDADVPLDGFVRTSIVNPDGYVNPRYLGGTMPANYGNLLSDEQIDGLVAFLVDVAS